MTLPPTPAYGGHAHWRLLSLAHTPSPANSVVLGVILGIVIIFVSANITLYESRPVAVQVTAVEWFVPGAPLATSQGFSMQGHEWVTVTLTCASLCYRINGAMVYAPFTLVSYSVVYHPIQYVNVTAQSPSTAYNGPLVVELSLG